MIKGKDVYIAKSVIIKRPELVTIGDHVAIDDFSVFTTGLILGDYIHISYGVTCIGGKDALLIMNDFSTVAAGVRIICASDEYKGHGLVSPLIPARYRDNVINRVVKISKFASIGTNAILLPGVKIGIGCVIGAGCVVSQNTVEWGIYAGNPMKIIGFREKEKMIEYGDILKNVQK